MTFKAVLFSLTRFLLFMILYGVANIVPLEAHQADGYTMFFFGAMFVIIWDVLATTVFKNPYTKEATK